MKIHWMCWLWVHRLPLAAVIHSAISVEPSSLSINYGAEVESCSLELFLTVKFLS